MFICACSSGLMVDAYCGGSCGGSAANARDTAMSLRQRDCVIRWPDSLLHSVYRCIGSFADASLVSISDVAFDCAFVGTGAYCVMRFSSESRSRDSYTNCGSSFNDSF